MNKHYTFDDIFLVPQLTSLKSRNEASTACQFGSKNTSVTLGIPIISANMDTVTGPKMASAMWNQGGIGALHRFNSIEDAGKQFLSIKEHDPEAECIVSIGVHDYKARCQHLADLGARFFLIDIAHGHSTMVKDTIAWIRNNLKSSVQPCIIAGNVATARGVRDLASWGADIVKVGIGPGACCKTRIVTGHGLPQFSAILECAEEAKLRGVKIIADGGIRNSGDIVKAFAAGTDYVMIGSLLSGTNETPGEILVRPDEVTGGVSHFKVYRGMASDKAREDSDEIREKSRDGDYSYVPAAEGVQTLVRCKGPVKDILIQLKKGLQSGMSYCDARELVEIKECSEWRVQTPAGFAEGSPHILR